MKEIKIELKRLVDDIERKKERKKEINRLMDDLQIDMKDRYID